jgi:hypothetical protein
VVVGAKDEAPRVVAWRSWRVSSTRSIPTWTGVLKAWSSHGAEGLARRQQGQVLPGGSLAKEIPFWRDAGASGDLVITGNSPDHPGLRLRAEIPRRYGDGTGFKATELVFPDRPCWQVTVHAGDAQFTFLRKVRSERLKLLLQSGLVRPLIALPRFRWTPRSAPSRRRRDLQRP